MENSSYVKYSAKFQRYQFKDLTHPITDPFIECVNLHTEKDRKTILTFYMIQGKSFEDGGKHLKYSVEKTLDKLVFIYITNITNLSLCSAYNASTKTPILYTSGGLRIGGSAMLVISSSDRYSTNIMKLPDDHIQSTYWHDFRLALQNESPVECYLALYGILLKIVGANYQKQKEKAKLKEQKEVDEIIRGIEPNVEQSEIPPSPGFTRNRVMETVYSRLRNEAAGHRYVWTIPECTRREIKLKIYNFKNLVKKAIEQS